MECHACCLFKNARESIEIEQYIFADDEIGRQFIEVLRERAWAGKNQNFCDTVGSWSLYTSQLPTVGKKTRRY